ncbi:MAG TPA: UDP-N-acetylmuramoyl-tripeptide--D-alanyl-D-alanine ligase [Bryobacteraceae bacterium]|jgi:UDP-N-acetylmuramoyl-tripeptide--D-alanyl-D-alanine ligase|nr:UDP-N-acetylmuramoyl-tripeptide--D-alanyl-D-alanine ligase [Bryobacteraceae bacterium]
MQFTLAQVCDFFGVRAGVPDVLVTGWSIDSRTVQPGDLFFAIKGENFDGHQFVKAAFEKGAVAAVVSEAVDGGGKTVLTTASSVSALGELARNARERWGKPVAGVTGSAGKTSTKDIIAAFLATRFRVGKTVGNFNNHIGLPLSILRIPDDSELAVLEMGMNHAGEIRALAGIAKPQIGVVTNVGYAHIEAFPSIEGIAAAKRELIESLPEDGVAVLNADDPRVFAFREYHRGRVLTYGFGEDAEIRADDLERELEGSCFRIGDVRFRTSLPGRHAVLNILAGVAVASLFGIKVEELVAAVAELTPGKMRGGRRQVRGITILDDSYNANPEAMRSMIDVLAHENAERKIAVLGEMLELGDWSEKLHREVGEYAASRGIDVVIGVRGSARFLAEAAGGKFFEDAKNAGAFLREFVKAGDAVLFKGSRGTHVEEALATMEE